jgi:hypothetical protein
MKVVDNTEIFNPIVLCGTPLEIHFYPNSSIQFYYKNLKTKHIEHNINKKNYQVQRMGLRKIY